MVGEVVLVIAGCDGVVVEVPDPAEEAGGHVDGGLGRGVGGDGDVELEGPEEEPLPRGSAVRVVVDVDLQAVEGYRPAVPAATRGLRDDLGYLVALVGPADVDGAVSPLGGVHAALRCSRST